MTEYEKALAASEKAERAAQKARKDWADAKLQTMVKAEAAYQAAVKSTEQAAAVFGLLAFCTVALLVGAYWAGAAVSAACALVAWRYAKRCARVEFQRRDELSADIVVGAVDDPKPTLGIPSCYHLSEKKGGNDD